MVDSVAVLSPTDRVFANGEPVSGAKLKFYNAGTTTPKAVYADADLSSSLGSTVYTDSDGFPVTSSGGSTKTAIFTNTAEYKLVVTDASDVTLITLDDLKGALDTSNFLTGASTNTMPVIAKTANYTILTTDAYKCINANPSGGSFTLTLPLATSAGDGWWVGLRNNALSSSNTVTVTRSGSDTIRHRLGSVSSFTLSAGGDSGFIVCDGSGYSFFPCPVLGGAEWEETTIASASSINLGATTGPVVKITGTTTITSFGSAPNRLRVLKFESAVTLTHNSTSLILPGGANLSVPAGGVIVVVSDGSGNWQAITSPPATFATQAQMESAADTLASVTPNTLKFSPFVAKVACRITYSGGTPTLVAGSTNVSSVEDTAVGAVKINFTTAFSNADYIALSTAQLDNGAQTRTCQTASQLAGSVIVRMVNNTPASADPEAVSFVAFGDF